MNRVVKVILAMAIALVYTIMIGMLVFLIFPEAKLNADDDYYKTTQNNYENCEDRTSYSQDSSRSDYCDNQVQAAVQQRQENTRRSTEILNRNRLKLALVFVILGFIVGFMSVSFAPLAVGMSAGATIIMILSTSIPGSTSIVDATTTLLYLACFILLVVMLFVIDKILPAPLVIGPVEYATTPVPASKSEPVVDATTLAPNGTIPPK